MGKARQLHRATDQMALLRAHHLKKCLFTIISEGKVDIYQFFQNRDETEKFTSHE